MSRRPRVCVVISDLHCGSTRAIMPPMFKTIEGQTLERNAAQKQLWAWWGEFWKFSGKVIGKDPWACVLNGDLTEGNHHRTTQIVSPEIADHAEMAKQILRPVLQGCSRVFVTLGTECHTAGIEHHIAHNLGAVPDPNTGNAAWERLSVIFAGTLCRFTHHTSTSTRPYLRGNKLGAHLRSAQIEAIDADRQPPKVVGASHCHTFDTYETTGGLCFTTPSWQLQTRYTHKVAPNAVCHIGGLILDWRGVDDGGLPRVHSWTRAYHNDIAVEA